MPKPAPKPGAGFFARLHLRGIELEPPTGPVDPRSQVIAEAALRGLRGEAFGGRKASGPRIPAERRKYLGNPQGYIRDIMGVTLVPQQEEALQLMESCDRLLIPSGNNLGKTYLLGLYGCYYLDVVGSKLDPENGEEQGARILLPGPDHKTILSTVYSKMLVMAERAESRGHRMPGERSLRSVTWRVRPEWEVEAFSPPDSVSEQVAHTASGRHHVNMIALVEEGQGVPERVWRATEGMCSGRGNKIISSFNPTEPSGPTFQRARRGDYRILHLDAFDHPNIRRRSIVVEGAVDFRVIDDRVRECQDRGAYPAEQPDPNYGEFLYALTPPHSMWEERGPRADGVPGHPDAEVKVYRPTPFFEAQVRGQWPRSLDSGLFSPAAVDASMSRWKEGQDPNRLPDRAGVDGAREGNDDTMFCRAWGESADVLLRAYAAAERGGEAKAIAELHGARRVRVSEMKTAPKGKGLPVAQFIYAALFGSASARPSFPWNVDEGGVGASVLDCSVSVLGVQAAGISFSATAPPQLPGEYLCENTRAALYVRAAMLLDRGLVDIPHDPLLREELLAQKLIWGSRVVEEIVAGETIKERKPSVRILEKPEIHKKIGRSPDRADALVLALWVDPPIPKREIWFGGGDGAPWFED